MAAQFTMYLKDILDKPYGGETVGAMIDSNLAVFPYLNDPDIDKSFYDLFIRRFNLQEIGFETIEGWMDAFLRVCDRAVLLYRDKLNLQLANMNTLLSRVIEEEDIHTSTNYLNPINGAAQPQVEEMKVNSANRTEYKNQRIAGLFKSNPEVMEEMAKMTVLYDELLTYFDRLFMGVI